MDTENLRDGVAVAGPHIQPHGTGGATVKFGTTTVTHGRKRLMDYTAQAMLNQPSAAIAALAANRCASLAANSLPIATTTATQAH